jgi:lysozyme family protein
MQAFDDAIAKLAPIEGGYINDPADSGGETNFGITVAVARAFGYYDPMRDMPRDVAVHIYRKRYWDALTLDLVALLAPAVALELFDSAVNCGPDLAAKWLQRSLNVLNAGATLYPDVTADGRVGPMTIAALREYLGKRGPEGITVLLRALNALQGAFYIGLAESRPTDERFVYGWLLQRVS